MQYEIEVKEVKKANFFIEADTLQEAKEQAHWRLLTQTEPSIRGEVEYKLINLE